MTEIKKDHLKYYLVANVLGWIAFAITTPIMWTSLPIWASLPCISLGGIYAVAGLGMLRHELWHSYLPGVNNRRWYDIVCFLLFLDPRVYRLSHAAHHSHVHTLKDLQISSPQLSESPATAWRIFVLEFFLGNLAWETNLFSYYTRKGMLKRSDTIRILVLRAGSFLGMWLLSSLLFPQSGIYFPLTILIALWSASVVTRHGQWMQHLGIISDASLKERNLQTRNVAKKGFVGRALNFLLRGDLHSHTWHHTDAGEYIRMDQAYQLAPNHQSITLRSYGPVLVNYFRYLRALTQ